MPTGNARPARRGGALPEAPCGRGQHRRCINAAEMEISARRVACCGDGVDGLGGVELEPPRGAWHRGQAPDRQHGLLHVPQLRAGPGEVRDADRELSPAPASLRRSELLRPRQRRGLRDPRRQQWRRRRGHDLPVRLRHQARQPGQGHHAEGRRQGRRDPAAAGRPDHGAGRRHDQRARELRAERDPRRPPRGQEPAGHAGERPELRQADRQHRHQDPAQLRRLRPAPRLLDQRPGLLDARPGVRGAARRGVRGEPRRGSSTW